MDNNEISKIKINNVTYNIKDLEIRKKLEELLGKQLVEEILKKEEKSQ